MNIPHALSLIIQRSHSIAAILGQTVELIAREMSMDSCSIYLLDPNDRTLRLTATHGLEQSALGKVVLALGEGLTGRVVAEMRSLAVEDASSHPGFRYFPETREERFQSYLGVPMVIRNRPVGAIVVQTREKRSYSQEAIETLSTIAAQLVGVVENARLIEALDRGDEDDPYLREVRRWHTSPPAGGEHRSEGFTLHGNQVSPGIAMGEVVFRGSYDLSQEPYDEPFRGVEEEKNRVRDALEKTSNDILNIQTAAAQETDEEHALIFSSHLLLLNDPVIQQQIDAAIEANATAPAAVYNALEMFGRRLQDVPSSYIKDRIDDIHDLRSRLLSHLFASGKRVRTSDRIVACTALHPSLVIELKVEGARGLITERGGMTSHGALLARSMSIPTVTGIADLFDKVHRGDRLIIDGRQGVVIVNPVESVVEEYRENARRLERLRTEYLTYRERLAATADNVRIELLANIGVTADLAVARENGAEGVGLYRTEFPFIIREHFPTREEQVKIYRKAYEYFPDGPLRFRLLDLGGDKFVPGGRITPDRNPFRGYRSIRVLFDYPHVLRDQVQAFALAAGKRPLSIIIPMLSSMEELRRVKKLIAEALDDLTASEAQRQPLLGAMIELPAAVEIVGVLAAEVDFLAIGSNDLIQYTLAIDRENSRVATGNESYHPAILNMIRRIVVAGKKAGKPVGVCGEMASKRRLALALIASGVDSLSVAPNAIPELKQELATSEVRGLAEEIDALLALPDAVTIDAELRRRFG